MSIWSKLFRNKTLPAIIQSSILNSRGNIDLAFPSDFSQEENELISSVQSMTMTSPERLVCLSRSIDYILDNGIGGDIVECGVWRGGSMLLVAKKLINAKDQSRNLFLFDTFEGMSEPGKMDVSAIDNKHAKDLLIKSDKFDGNNIWCYSSLDEVRKNIRNSEYDERKIFFVKGKVEDTLPHPSIRDIALLRLDTDWYASTKHELETLFDHLVPGGVLVIDDYGHWSGCKKAVDEFIKERKLKIFLNRIDYTGRIAIKT